MKEAGRWSRYDLAKATGLPKNTIDNLFKSTRKMLPYSDQLYLIANALGVSMEYLLTGEEIKPEIRDPDISQIVHDLELLKKIDPVQVKSFKKQIHAMLLSEISNQHEDKKEKHA